MFSTKTKMLISKINKIIDAYSDLDMKPRCIVFYRGLPLLLTKERLQSAISTTYITTKDKAYLELSEEILPTELKRAKAKLGIKEDIGKLSVSSSVTPSDVVAPSGEEVNKIEQVQ